MSISEDLSSYVENHLTSGVQISLLFLACINFHGTFVMTASCLRPLTLHRHGMVGVPRLNNDCSASELIWEVILSGQGRPDISGGELHAHVSSSSYRGRAAEDNSIFWLGHPLGASFAQMHYVEF